MSVPFWEDMVVRFEAPVIQEGYIKVPELPGLARILRGNNRDYALERAFSED
jgi:hypothetical protein